MKTITRPFSSRIARACGVALSAPRSEVRPPGPAPEINRRNLRDALDLHQLVEYLMVERQIDDRITGGRENLSHLTLEKFPSPITPEVVGPEESSLQQISTEIFRFRLIQRQPADFRHHDEAAMKELRLLKVDQQVIRQLVLVHADAGLRQLRKANRQVFVRSRKIHIPSVAVAVWCGIEDNSTELE
jgi:hypothetical protein